MHNKKEKKHQPINQKKNLIIFFIENQKKHITA